MDLLPQDFTEQIDIAGSGYVAISTRDVERSVRFYARLFGFRVIDRRHDEQAAHVLLTARGNAFVAIHEQRAPAASAPGMKRWVFAVPDLDLVRETLWNQGVVPVAGRMAPPAVFASAEQRFLVIRDPDGHEIELVEEARADTPSGRAQTLRCGERSERPICGTPASA